MSLISRLKAVVAGEDYLDDDFDELEYGRDGFFLIRLKLKSKKLNLVTRVVLEDQPGLTVILLTVGIRDQFKFNYI